MKSQRYNTFFLTAFFVLIQYFAMNQQLMMNDQPLIEKWPDMPEQLLPDTYRNRDLPAVVDNSQNIYFRPIFSQIGASCGQASSIGYMFTYEMCRARNVAADIPANQFPSHFAYNFYGYDGYYGVNYLHSLDVVKHVGTPDLETYGGMAIDEGTVWISGYEKYYNAMCNRAHQIKMIRTGNEEGLLNLKHWLAHHHEGADVGGVANFASGTPYIFVTIPPQSPEAGKKLVTFFPGSVATHAMTIVGYNDSIRYDLNGDGQFTNNLDITNDGVVDMRDWEIGALIISNSYGENWANNGFYFALYRTLALNEYNGGMWGSMVHVVDVKPDYHPEMAVKIRLKHNVREQIKVVAGVSGDPQAQSPDQILNFPVFNYQGGKHFMQGGTSNPENKTIEFGLDITPLLSYINPGEEASFFLKVFENDPLGSGIGEIISFSLMDYTSGNLVEIACPEANVVLENNNVTRLKINHVSSFDDVTITTEQLPVVDAGFTLQAEGGSEPYEWKLLTPYSQQILDAQMPVVQQEQLSLEAPYYKYAVKELGFSFPFYGENFDKVYVNEAGFILFEPDIFPWRYLRDTYHLFREMKHISAFLFAPVLFYEGTKQMPGIWYEGDANHATFRWNLDLVYYDNYIGHGEFAVRLFPDGSIDFFFNDIEVEENILWFAGVSAGGDTQHTLLKNANSRNFYTNKAFRLTPDLVADGYSLSDDGYFIATPASSTDIQNLFVEASDFRGIRDVKQFQYSPDIRFECSFITADGQLPHNGSNISVDLRLTNAGGVAVEGLMVGFAIDDPMATVTANETVAGTLASGQTLSIPNAFSFTVGNQCPDGHSLIATLNFDANGLSRNGMAAVQIQSGGLELGSYLVIDDDNNRLDAGENASIVLNVVNNGSLVASDVMVQLSTTDPYVSIFPTNALPAGDIFPGNSSQVSFDVEVDSSCPIDHHAIFQLDLINSEGTETMRELQLVIGQYNVLVLNKCTNSISATAMVQALDSLGLSYHVTTTFDENIFKHRAVLLCQGTYGTIVNLTASEQELLGDYLDQGGNVYRESFYGWNGAGFFPEYFSTNYEVLQNAQLVNTLFGVAGTDFEGFGADFVATINVMSFRLLPTNAYAFPVIRANFANDAWSAVASVRTNYKTLASIFEFGNIGLPDETQVRKELMRSIMRFFRMEHLIVGNTEILSENPAAMKLEVFPNPSTGRISIDISQAVNETITLNLLKPEGVMVSSAKVMPLPGMRTRYVLDELGMNTNLKPGVYLLEAQNSQGKTVVKLIRN